MESTDKIIVRWNLPRLAADLLEQSPVDYEEYLEPYNLSPDDFNRVVELAWGCIDCGRLWDWYVVRNDVWRRARLKPADYCCRDCLALRLKRPLRPRDFTWEP